MITAEMHDCTAAQALQQDGLSWIRFSGPGTDNVAIYTASFEIAQATADAFNAATAARKQANAWKWGIA